MDEFSKISLLTKFGFCKFFKSTKYCFVFVLQSIQIEHVHNYNRRTKIEEHLLMEIILIFSLLLSAISILIIYSAYKSCFELVNSFLKFTFKI